MKKVLIGIVVLLVAVVALGYFQGWFGVKKEDGKLKVVTDPARFKQDKAAFSKLIAEKARAAKDKVASMRKKSEGLTGEDKAHAEKELAELETKHDRLEKQLQELEGAGEDKFETIKQDLTKSLEDVEKRMDELTKKLEKGQAK
jgi:hypothetical protein